MSEQSSCPTPMQPYLICSDAGAAIEFYKSALGAIEVFRLNGTGGSVVHAALSINGATCMVVDEQPGCGSASPTTLGNSPVAIHLNVDDTDAWYQNALHHGATSVIEPHDAFWGDRFASFVDPSGHRWSLAHPVREVSPEDMQAAMAAMGM